MRHGKYGNKQRNTIILFIGISLLLHLLFVFVFPVDWSLSTPSLKKEDKPLTVDLDPNLLKQMSEQSKQIVESESSANKTKPKDAKYLGERDQSVDQETRAHKVDSFRSGAPASGGQNGKQKLTLKSLAPKDTLTPPKEGEYSEKKPEKEQPLAEGNPGKANPAQEAADNDLLRGVKEGDRTMLSTKEFIYFGYYHRIRERLERAWNSKLSKALENYVYSGRQLAGGREYITRLVVVLDRHGKVISVQVLGASGARDLDQAAIESFNQAGPFPDPPAGLVDQNGEIKIPWEFILQS